MEDNKKERFPEIASHISPQTMMLENARAEVCVQNISSFPTCGMNSMQLPLLSDLQKETYKMQSTEFDEVLVIKCNIMNLAYRNATKSDHGNTKSNPQNQQCEKRQPSKSLPFESVDSEENNECANQECKNP